MQAGDAVARQKLAAVEVPLARALRPALRRLDAERPVVGNEARPHLRVLRRQGRIDSFAPDDRQITSPSGLD